MPDDTGAHGAIADSEAATSAHRRGPLRPERLQSVRNRVSGAGLARLFQAGDATALVLASVVASQFMTLPEVMWLGAPALALVLLGPRRSTGVNLLFLSHPSSSPCCLRLASPSPRCATMAHQGCAPDQREPQRQAATNRILARR